MILIVDVGKHYILARAMISHLTAKSLYYSDKFKNKFVQIIWIAIFFYRTTQITNGQVMNTRFIIIELLIIDFRTKQRLSILSFRVPPNQVAPQVCLLRRIAQYIFMVVSCSTWILFYEFLTDLLSLTGYFGDPDLEGNSNNLYKLDLLVSSQKNRL